MVLQIILPRALLRRKVGNVTEITVAQSFMVLLKVRWMRIASVGFFPGAVTTMCACFTNRKTFPPRPGPVRDRKITFWMKLLHFILHLRGPGQEKPLEKDK